MWISNTMWVQTGVYGRQSSQCGRALTKTAPDRLENARYKRQNLRQDEMRWGQKDIYRKVRGVRGRARMPLGQKEQATYRGSLMGDALRILEVLHSLLVRGLVHWGQRHRHSEDDIPRTTCGTFPRGSF